MLRSVTLVKIYRLMKRVKLLKFRILQSFLRLKRLLRVLSSRRILKFFVFFSEVFWSIGLLKLVMFFIF